MFILFIYRRKLVCPIYEMLPQTGFQTSFFIIIVVHTYLATRDQITVFCVILNEPNPLHEIQMKFEILFSSWFIHLFLTFTFRSDTVEAEEETERPTRQFFLLYTSFDKQDFMELNFLHEL